jgi:hypothetical protein
MAHHRTISSMASMVAGNFSLKATKPIPGAGGGPLKLIHRIERVIVHPKNSDR